MPVIPAMAGSIKEENHVPFHQIKTKKIKQRRTDSTSGWICFYY
jgi:hypothetical protein